ncbi:MAG: MnmC family methyltransferase, partial [Balneolaceae bacterium]
MDNTDDTSLHRCKDGSHTLYSSRFQQYYHNPNGAIAESRHVFFDTPGWMDSASPDEPFHLFEMGFGTGLNLLLLLESLGRMDHPPQIVYHAVEAYPLTQEQAAMLNYQELLELPDNPTLPAGLFENLQPGKNHRQITPNLTLNLYIGRFDQYPGPPEPLGMIFFDAFSPDVNPALWNEDVFRKLAGWSAPDA